MNEEREFSNIIVIGKDKKPVICPLCRGVISEEISIKNYENAILLAMCPEIYDKYESIIIQTTRANLFTAELVIKLFKNAGLYEESREKKAITVNTANGSYILPDAYEIILKKIPALRH